MSRPKITIVGTLRWSEDEVQHLRFSLDVGEPGKRRTGWFEALPNWDNWPGLGMRPERPTRWASKAAEEEWQRDCDAYDQALSSDPSYREAASTFLERQRREPQPIIEFSSTYILWAYRDNVLRIESTEPEALRDDVLAVKHFVLRRERQYERVRKEVEALENMEKLEGASREPIAENVRLFVWQRDGGQCVKCSSRERLEFDHIIPIAAGGSSTERNVQLLCETCNRSKGATI